MIKRVRSGLLAINQMSTSYLIIPRLLSEIFVLLSKI